MPTYTRREFGDAAVAAALSTSALLGKPNSRIAGVQLGVQSWSFYDRPLDEAIKAMVEIGFSSCELALLHLEPKLPREDLRKWRATVSMDHFREARKKFDNAGIAITAYIYNMRPDFSDEEIERGFEMAKALGVKCITTSSTVSMALRIDRYASRAKIYAGMHNHSSANLDEFAIPESFERAMQGASPYMGINLDIGHFVAAGFDPLELIEKRHDRILSLHLKDRKKAQGPNMPFGQGDTPIHAVLQLLSRKRYPIPANIEYEYKGGDNFVEVKRCFDYCREALA